MMLNSPEQYCQVSPNIVNYVRPFSDLQKCGKISVGERFGPVPNLFKWLHRQIVNLERLHESNQLYKDEHRDSVEIALKTNQQNIEIVYDGDEYYFDVLSSFNVNTDGIKAWLSKQIEAKLVFKPAKTWLNGCKTYYCLMCNLFSPHFNFIMLHMIFTCPKLANKINKQTLSLENNNIVKHKIEINNNNNNNNNNNSNHNNNNSNNNNNNNNNKNANKKRGGFDIQSLLNAKQDEDEDDEESIDVETLEDSEILDVGIEDQLSTNKRNSLLNEYKHSAFKKLKTSHASNPAQSISNTDIPVNKMPNLASLYTQFGPALFANTFANFITNQSFNPFIEPNTITNFPMVGQLPPKETPSPSNISVHSKNHSPSQNLCTSPSYSETSTQSVTSSSLSPNIPTKHKSEAKVKREKPDPESLKHWPTSSSTISPDIGSNPSTSGSSLPPYYVPPANNSLLSSIYLLSPSLTALSFQASNVCAHCQTAFRMTSDLVYHMRSHHKSSKERRIGESSKKKRGEMLRCTICDETFRERHHLTRHMTSHQ